MLARSADSPYSLRFALAAFVLGPCILLMSLAGWLGLASLERFVHQRMQEDIELISRALVLPVNQAVSRGDLGSVLSALASAASIDQVYGVYVYDHQGERIASTGTREAAVASEEVLQLAGVGEETGEFEQRGGEEIFSYFQPLTDAGGRINGLLQITRRGSDFEDYLQRLRLAATGLVGFTGGMLALIVFLGHHRAVGRHVQRIEHAMDRVARGAIAHRVPLTGPKELCGLAGGINQMLDGITRAHEELERHRAAEAELKEQLAKSEKMAAIGQLAAGVAHELGTPLATVNGRAQQALRDPHLAGKTRRALEDVQGEVRRMEQIVRQLMDFARRNPLRTQRVPVQRLVQSALAQLETDRSLDAARVRVAGAQTDLRLSVDPVRAEQALVNLLRNALQAARAAVEVRWFDDARGRGFVVDDDGPGVPQELVDQVFEPFFTTKDVGKGTGLGLAVVHAVAEAHRGTVAVERSPLGGARFRLVLDARPSGS